MATSRTASRSLSRASQFIIARRPWACSACRNGFPRRFQRGVATTPEVPNKPYYVTTPIFYVNAGESLKQVGNYRISLTIPPNLTSSPCWPFLHHDHCRYPQTMAGSTWQRCSITDRYRRTRDEGKETKVRLLELLTDSLLQIQQASLAAGMDTQAFCDMNCRTFEVGIPFPPYPWRGNSLTRYIFKSLAKAANLSNDHFIRTTDSAHRDAVQYFWVG